MNQMDQDQTRQIVLDPEDFPSVQAEPLAPIEQEALQYWTRFLPNLTKALKAQGQDVLETAVRKAYHQREYAISLLRSRNPTLHPIQAASILREEQTDPLWPPPERPTVPA